MKTSDLIRKLCEDRNMPMAELARQIGQSPQNFSKKVRRDTFTLDEMNQIAETVGVEFTQAFVLPDGKEINLDE